MSLTRILCDGCGYPLAFCACEKPKAASELAQSETAGPAKVVAAVATGSLPVSSAKATDIEVGTTTSGKVIITIVGGERIRIDTAWAMRLRDRLEEAIRQAIAWNERQPEENAWFSAETQLSKKMIVMPANATGMFFHCLARETGRLGHLYSPGAERGPWPWFPYALDNGCFSLWTPETNHFDERAWRDRGEAEWRRLIFWASAAPQKPMWAIVPDWPGDWTATARKYRDYVDELTACGIPLAIAVQDGCTVRDVRNLTPTPAVVFVGGSTEWKWATAANWVKNFPRVHVGRCNTPEKLYWLESLGCESCDGTGWNRGDRTQTRGLEEWARSRAASTAAPLWPHASRARSKNQLCFA